MNEDWSNEWFLEMSSEMVWTKYPKRIEHFSTFTTKTRRRNLFETHTESMVIMETNEKKNLKFLACVLNANISYGSSPIAICDTFESYIYLYARDAETDLRNWDVPRVRWGKCCVFSSLSLYIRFGLCCHIGEHTHTHSDGPLRSLWMRSYTH